MKAKIICQENFQTVEMEVEVETLEELANTIYNLRQAIKQGTSDVKNKQDSQPRPAAAPQQQFYNGNGNRNGSASNPHPTPKQQQLLDQYGVPRNEYINLTPAQASNMITELQQYGSYN